MPLTRQNVPELNRFAEKELQRALKFDSTWDNEIESRNKYVNNNIIVINTEGEPTKVLINNNTYPIPVLTRPDGSIVIQLDKFDTENTEITDDELYALPYDKPGSVQRQHREEIEKTFKRYGLHSFAPLVDTPTTPVLTTTGTTDSTGRKRLTFNDLIVLEQKLSDIEVPLEGRILVLTGQHKADLLLEDKTIFNQLADHKKGMINNNLYGFKIYEDVYAPLYDAAGNKLAFGAVPSATAKKASTVFHKKSVFKATGTTKRYLAIASENPEYRKSVVGFRQHGIMIPDRDKGLAAIISG